MNGSSIFHHSPSVPFSEENMAGGLLGQAQMHMACESSSEDNMATDPRFLTPKKQTRVKKEKFEEEDDEYIDENTPPPSSNKRRRLKSEGIDYEAESPSKVVKSTPTKGGRRGRATATAIGRQEIELLFDRLSARLPTQEWQSIVNEMNRTFGTSRRADNVRTHWNAVSRKKLVSAYGGAEGNGKV